MTTDKQKEANRRNALRRRAWRDMSALAPGTAFFTKQTHFILYFNAISNFLTAFCRSIAASVRVF